jgi:hypothetical protein
MLLRTVTSTLLLLALSLAVSGLALASDDPSDGEARPTAEGGAGDEDRSDRVDGPLPRVGARGPVEDAPDGLSLSPAVLEVATSPGRRVEVRHVVANTTDAPLELRIDVPNAAAASAGPAIDPEPAAPLPADAAARLVAPVDRLQLAPGEGVDLLSTAEVTGASSGLVALRATTRGGTSVTALVVLADGSQPAGVQATARAAADGERRTSESAAEGEGERDAEVGGLAGYVDLVADRHAVVDVRIRVRSWIGILSDRTLADVVVGPDEPRVLEVERPAGAPPGRLRLEVVTVDRAGDVARSEITTSVGITPAVVALVLLVIAGVWVGRLLRRRHLRSQTTATTRAGAPVDTPPPPDDTPPPPDDTPRPPDDTPSADTEEPSP